MNNWLKAVLNGITKENPVLILMIGLCPVLACSSNAMDAVGIGGATAVVLICTNFIVSVLRKWIQQEIRALVYIVITATLVSLVDHMFQLYFPALSESLGIFIPLIAVNCIILGRAELFAGKNGVLLSLADGLGMGIGFFLVILALSAGREVLGAGSIFGYKLGISDPAVIMLLPPGAFLSMGILTAVWNAARKNEIKAEAGCSACGLSQACHPAEEVKNETPEKPRLNPKNGKR